MTPKRKVQVFTLTGLAKALDSSYGYIRQVLIKYQKGEIKDHHGFKFFGQVNKAWFAYKSEDFEIEVLDAPELLPSKGHKDVE